MAQESIPFQLIDWSTIPKEEYKGAKGTAYWQLIEFETIRIRIIEYSEGYLADHWCRKGHVVYCLEGEMVNEFEDGSSTIFKKGMSYVVSDNLSSHRSVTEKGVKLLLIDGEFLR